MKMKKTIRKWAVYPLWEAMKEERDLNLASKKGLQLVKCASYYWVLEKDDTVRYTYQLDFNPATRNDSRYKEMFADMGWEYISSTFNGWHYFRKTYKEGQQLENGEVVESERLYTDKESIEEMENRWQSIGNFLIIFSFLFSLFSFCLIVILNEIKFFGFGLAFLFYGITIKTSINNYKQKKNNPNFVPKLRIPFGFSNLLFLFLVIITFISIAL